MNDTLHIDGRQGEGGGQVLRTSLSLAATLGRPVTIEHVRGGRKKPGLLRQHRTALRAVRDMTRGTIEGDELGSNVVHFTPGERCHGGEYRFGIGSAGSTMLVLQTVLPLLLVARESSQVVLQGGTHNPSAPPFDAFDGSFLPCLRSMGANLRAELVRPGFVPAGGGEVRLDVEPTQAPRKFELLERGEAGRPSCEVLLQHLPDDIAEREWKAFQRRAHWTRDRLHIHRLPGGSGPGNVMLAKLPFEHVTNVFSSFGQLGKSSEIVGRRLAGLCTKHQASDAPVDPFLADQLMLPLALLAGGRFRCTSLTLHAETNAQVINLFLPAAVTIERDIGPRGEAEIRVRGLRGGTSG